MSVLLAACGPRASNLPPADGSTGVASASSTTSGDRDPTTGTGTWGVTSSGEAGSGDEVCQDPTLDVPRACAFRWNDPLTNLFPMTDRKRTLLFEIDNLTPCLINLSFRLWYGWDGGEASKHVYTYGFKANVHGWGRPIELDDIWDAPPASRVEVVLWADLDHPVESRASPLGAATVDFADDGTIVAFSEHPVPDGLTPPGPDAWGTTGSLEAETNDVVEPSANAGAETGTTGNADSNGRHDP